MVHSLTLKLSRFLEQQPSSGLQSRRSSHRTERGKGTLSLTRRQVCWLRQPSNPNANSLKFSITVCVKGFFGKASNHIGFAMSPSGPTICNLTMGCTPWGSNIKTDQLLQFGWFGALVDRMQSSIGPA